VNPIELAWAKLNALLRSAGAGDIQALAAALERTRDLLTPCDTEGWFRHSGHAALPRCA
jgi:hypothetical protein